MKFINSSNFQSVKTLKSKFLERIPTTFFLTEEKNLNLHSSQSENDRENNSKLNQTEGT